MGKLIISLVFTSISSAIIYFCVAEVDMDFALNTFSRREVCHMQDIIDNGCVVFQKGVRSLLECTALCRTDCYGVYMPNCYHHTHHCSLNSFPNCSLGDSVVFFYTKNQPCQNDGVWNQEDNTCKCCNGWVGERCERLPKTCTELKVYGYPTGWPDGRRWVYLHLDTYPTPVSVLCDVYDIFTNTLLMVSYGQFSNNRTWSDYFHGYFYDESNFWIGLDKMKAINDAGLTKLYLTTGFVDPKGDHSLFLRQFNDFSLSDMSSGFTFTFSTTMSYASGPYKKKLKYGDCLSPVKGGKFSTWDNDNDEVPTENCAAEAGVGWWFKDCNMTCNPLGWSYQTKPGPETKSHVKMNGIDFESKTYAWSSEVLMQFSSP